MLDIAISQAIDAASSIKDSAQKLDSQYHIWDTLNATANKVATEAYAMDERYHVSENAAHSTTIMHSLLTL